VFATFGSGCRMAARNHNCAGVSYFKSGQMTQAINEFQQALARDPQNAEAYYNLGSAYYQLAKQTNNPQMVQQSEQLLRQAIALNERHVESHRALAVLLTETGRSNYAFDLMNAWQRRNPYAADPLIELARLSEEIGDVNRAGEYLADALRIDGYNPRALKAMGRVREQQGQLHLALENYMRSYQRDNRQADLAQHIQQLQGRLASATPAPPGLNSTNTVPPYR
jgi:tetratricopeptide (TPR) repeat protein